MDYPVDPTDETITSLALYYTSWCPYCRRVLRAIKRLGLSDDQVIMRDVDDESQHDDDLREARDRGTVPVLRIQYDEGEMWMPESVDIIDWLDERFGRGAPRGA